MIDSLMLAARRAAAAVQRSWQRRRALAELRALDDRMLADIGLQRDNLESVVAAMDADRMMHGVPHPAAVMAVEAQNLAALGRGFRSTTADRAA